MPSATEDSCNPGDTFRLVYLDGLKTVTMDLRPDGIVTVTFSLVRFREKNLTSTVVTRFFPWFHDYHSYSNAVGLPEPDLFLFLSR